MSALASRPIERIADGMIVLRRNELLTVNEIRSVAGAVVVVHNADSGSWFSVERGDSLKVAVDEHGQPVRTVLTAEQALARGIKLPTPRDRMAQASRALTDMLADADTGLPLVGWSLDEGVMRLEGQAYSIRAYEERRAVIDAYAKFFGSTPSAERGWLKVDGIHLGTDVRVWADAPVVASDQRVRAAA